MKKNKQSLKNYNVLKVTLRIITLVMAVVSIVISLYALNLASQAKDQAKSNELVIDNIIEKTLFKDYDKTK